MHWYTSAGLGFDAFSLDPTANLFNIPSCVGLMNMMKLVSVWSLWLWLVPFSAKRKLWRYNLLGKVNDCFEWALFHRQGMFHGSHLKFDEPSLDSYHKEPTMFCILPHGTLPTRVLDVWHKFDHFFDEVCCFFGSQVALVHGNCYTLAMRGEFMPANKPELIRVMRTNQSVSLLPGVISEMMNCDSHSPQINVSIKHKSFIKVALQHGYDLVPTFFFQATKQYDLLVHTFSHF
jgi:Diacylglycerol acyltransferase